MKALELIAQAKTNTRGQGFDAEDATLADLTMSDPLRASLYAFNVIQKKRKKVEGAPKPALGRKVARVGVVGAGSDGFTACSSSCSVISSAQLS